MSDAPDHAADRIRALAEGRLTPAEEERLALELARDPELGRFAEEYREVHALTRGADVPPPPCGLRAEDLARRLAAPRRERLVRRVAAAAAILAVGALALLALLDRAGGSGRPEAPLVLHAIELADLGPGDLAPDAPIATVPAGLTTFEPRAGGEVRWLGDLEQAVSYSRAVGCPLLVYGTWPNCPIAAQLDREVFEAGQVLDLVECYVPVRLDLSRLPPEETEALVAGGYPCLEVWDPSGVSRHELDRTPVPESFASSMREGLMSCGSVAAPADWERAHELARLALAAQAAESEGRLGAALGDYSRLVLRAEPGTLLELGRAGRRRLSAEARELFLRARELAGEDVERAGALLRESAERFHGTAIAEDFAAAASRLAEDGCFPPVVGARAS